MDKNLESEKINELFKKHDIQNEGKIDYETFLNLFDQINIEYNHSLYEDLEENLPKLDVEKSLDLNGNVF